MYYHAYYNHNVPHLDITNCLQCVEVLFTSFGTFITKFTIPMLSTTLTIKIHSRAGSLSGVLSWVWVNFRGSLLGGFTVLSFKN